MKKIFYILCLLFPFLCEAQQFAIRTIELTPEKVVLYYDLVDTTRNRTYTVHVYSSNDNFIAPLSKLNGDYGLEVRPGTNKRIEWNAKEELGATFKGDVELEIRGRVYIPFIQFEGMDKLGKVKRQSPFLVKWSGGTRQNILNFQLYKRGKDKDKLVYVFPNIANASEHKFTLPTSVPPGKDYYFVVSDTKNKDMAVTTPRFEVKRKYPLALKVLGTALVGAAVYALLPDSDSGSAPPKVSDPVNTLPGEK